MLDVPHDAPYSEETFRFLLETEWKRAERSRRSLVLLLVRLKKGIANDGRIDGRTAAGLFAGLAVCVREIDFLGWYRTGRVVGAVLPQRAAVPSEEVCSRIGDRAMKKLCDHVPTAVAERLRVKVLQVRPRTVS